MASTSLRAGFQGPPNWYWASEASLKVTRYQSITSSPPLVMPQAILRLKPMMTAGEPGKEAPYTLRPGAESWISYQMEGRLRSRWGSLASKGRPLAVCAPETTKLLLPLPGSGLRLGSRGGAVSRALSGDAGGA